MESSSSANNISNGNRNSVCSNGRVPAAGSVQYLEQCRQARIQEQEVARQEEIRLKQILEFCEEYNKECDRFFRLEQALNRSAPKTPAKYLFARKENIACHSSPDAVRDERTSYHITTPANPRNNNNIHNDSTISQKEQTLDQNQQICSAMQNSLIIIGNDDENNDQREFSPDNANIREQTASPASTITDELVNRKPNHSSHNSDLKHGTSIAPDARNEGEDEDEEDEELKEFQALEKEVNMTDSITKIPEDQPINQRNGVSNGSALNGRASCSIMKSAIQCRETNIDDVSLIVVPLAQQEQSSGSLSTPDGSDETITAASSDDKLTMTTATTDFSSLLMSIHSSMRLKRSKASSLPPNEHYSISDPNQRNRPSRAFDTSSLKAQNVRDKRRAVSVNPTMSRSLTSSHGHASNGLIAEMKVLGHNLSAFSCEDMQISCCTCSGYLWKLCSDRKKWKKRFFHFDRYHKVFFYYKTADQFRKVKKPNGGVGFIELKDVAVDRERSMISQPILRSGSDPSIPNAVVASTSENNNTSVIGKKGSQRDPKYATFLRNKKQPNQNNNTILFNSSNKKSSHHQKSIDPKSSSSAPFKYVFNVETTNRQFILSTHSFELMRLWVDVIFTGIESYFD